MAKKKNDVNQISLAEEPIKWVESVTVTDNDGESEPIIIEALPVKEPIILNKVAEKPAKFIEEIYRLEEGDTVSIIEANAGNSKYTGTGYIVDGRPGLRWVSKVIRGAAFPYELINSNKKVIGYFKDKSLKKR